MKRSVCVALFLVAICILSSAGAEEDLPTLRYNRKGDAVVALQERLTELGYYTFRVTGVYQENTQKAVREFQADNGLEPTGVADADLQRMILSADARPKATPAPADLAAPFPGTMQYGSTGEDVARIQTRLTQLGYYEIEISSQFLGNTRNAVRAFQGQNGLKVDGVVGEDTWVALFFDETAVDVTATPKPTPAPTPVPYFIGVDVTNQVITVYGLDENLEYTAVIRRMLCSTGTERDPTPLKTYTLNGDKARWCYFPKWGTHAQYWTRMDSANAFHSVIYSEANPMALKTGSYTGLGKRASHGCVRLMIEDAKWIYDNCGKGTEVLVYEGEKDEELTKSLKIPPLDYSVMLPKPTPGPTASPEYDGSALPPMPFTTLERGVESEAVYWLQCKLTELGYYAGSITGGYYAGTVEAVKAFQRDYGLSVDGKAGKQTLAKLYEAVLATPEPSLEPTPTLTPLPTPTQRTTAAPAPAETAEASPLPSPSQAPWYF